MGFDVSFTEKPRGWTLSDANEMFEALKELIEDEARFGRRFRGSLCVWREKDGQASLDGEVRWYLEIVDAENLKHPVRGNQDDHLLFAGNVLQKLTTDSFANVVERDDGQAIEPKKVPERSRSLPPDPSRPGVTVPDSAPLTFERGKKK